MASDQSSEGASYEASRSAFKDSEALEAAFEASAEAWWDLGRALSSEPSAGLAHAPACVVNASDLGQTMALAKIGGVGQARTALGRDSMWTTSHLAVRGYAARCFVALRVASTAARLRIMRRHAEPGRPALLVYGHPASTPEGTDAYFGDLMPRLPELRRILHVDCGAERARALSQGGRTSSLHAWGSPWFAFTLPFARWRPSRRQLGGAWGGLVRRAAILEGGTGQAAAIAWQIHCQRRWLEAVHPTVVAWPWENHSWERAFVRDARRLGVRTVGYQHSVVGRHMLNYSPRSNPDGLASIPDVVVCTGEATRLHLARWGIPEERLVIGGALRFREPAHVPHDPAAPVFMALPFDGAVAAEMVDAARNAAKSGRWRFAVKPHPMTPHVFENSPGMEMTDIPFGKWSALSAVVYAATTVGLESILAGIPTLRFRPRDRIAIDILPDGVSAPTTGLTMLAEDLNRLQPHAAIDRSFVFADVRDDVWRRLLCGESIHEK